MQEKLRIRQCRQTHHNSHTRSANVQEVRAVPPNRTRTCGSGRKKAGFEKDKLKKKDKLNKKVIARRVLNAAGFPFLQIQFDFLGNCILQFTVRKSSGKRLPFTVRKSRGKRFLLLSANHAGNTLFCCPQIKRKEPSLFGNRRRFIPSTSPGILLTARSECGQRGEKRAHLPDFCTGE